MVTTERVFLLDCMVAKMLYAALEGKIKAYCGGCVGAALYIDARLNGVWFHREFPLGPDTKKWEVEEAEVETWISDTIEVMLLCQK